MQYDEFTIESHRFEKRSRPLLNDFSEHSSFPAVRCYCQHKLA